MPAAKLGEIVHGAIQWELPPNDAALRDLLARFAWEEGIVDDQAHHARRQSRVYDLVQRVSL